MKKSGKFLPVLAALLLVLSTCSAVFADANALVTTTSEQAGSADTVYVLGNPAAYPIEYYNTETKRYEGIMPSILEKVAQETGLRFTYIDGGLKDVRAKAAENGQAEMVSGLSSSDGQLLSKLKTKGNLLLSVTDNYQETYFFGYTNAASDDLIKKVESAAAKVSKEEMLEYSVIAASGYQPSEVAQNYFIPAAAAAAILLLAVIILAVKLRNAANAPVIAADSGVQHLNTLSLQAFKERYAATITNESCSIYYLFFISFDTELVAQKYGVAFMERQLKYAEEVLEEIINRDEFACETGNGILAACPSGSRDNAEKWIQKVLGQINGSLERGNIAYFRAGIFSYSGIAIDCDSALRNVKQGFRAALAGGRDYIFCDKAMLKQLEDMVQLSNDIPSAFTNHEIKLFMQPIVNRDDKAVGAEVLCRWIHPRRGLLHPGAFLDAFTETGNIIKLDLYIFNEACRLMEDWQKRGINKFMTCNFSRATIDSATFADALIKIASQYDFDYGYIIVEIIEDFMEVNKDQALANIRKIKDAGFLIGLDDIGSGTTRFSDLIDYPIDLFKIDRSILLQADTEKGRNLLQSMIQFAYGIDMKPLCEGVESIEDVQMLKSMDIKFLQGYYYYRPMPVEEVEKIFTS